MVPGYWKDSEEKFFILVTLRALPLKKLPTRKYQTFSRNCRVHIAFYQTFGFGYTVKITVHMVTSRALLFKKLPTTIYQIFSRLYRVYIAFYQTFGFIFTVIITVKIVLFLPLLKYTKFWHVVIFTTVLVPGYWRDSEEKFFYFGNFTCITV